MNPRTVSLVLIAAVVACPMWCGTGSCNAGQCCGEEASESDRVCTTNEAESRCCHHKPDSDDDQQCPTHSSPTSCQGVCGGAVLAKDVEVRGDSHVIILPLIDDHAAMPARLVECGRCRNEQHCCHSNANHGRVVRTLHMSFLC